MSEFQIEDPEFPEDLIGARDELLLKNARFAEAGEDDGLVDIRAEVAADPVALRAYLEANARTKRLLEAEEQK